MEFKTEKVTDRITRIFAFNTELMYLVEGTEKAALLDTGSGFCSLKKCVEALTDKPLVVLLTHGHTDHAMGAAEFDQVYMSSDDKGAFAVHGQREFRLGSAGMFEPLDRFAAEDYIPTPDPDTFHELKEGDVFELGGISIEAFACPGHTFGSMVFLIPEERLLLTGDSCNFMTFLFGAFSTGVEEYRRSLQRLLKLLSGRYDGVLLSHGDGVGVPDMIERVIEVCDDILTGRADNVPFDFNGEKSMMAKAVGSDRMRLDGKAGNLVYDKLALPT